VAIQTDPCDSGETALVVGGTTGSDTIVFARLNNAGDIAVSINGVLEGVFNPTGHIIAYGQAGDDDIELDASIALDAWFYGDAGNDRLKTGLGASILLGGDGDDMLISGTGRSILIGGNGEDRLNAGGGEDILIGGVLDDDRDALVLCALLDTWNSTVDEYAVRVAKLRLLLNDTTVSDDEDVDMLIGSSGLDWFFSGVGDVVMNVEDGESEE
jgi:Ca2+-binding RTX toxin-like protein